MVLGRIELLEDCDNPELLKSGRTIAAVCADQGWRGPLNIQFKRERQGDFLAIEMNGRFAGGSSARCYVGSDEIREGLNAWLGEGTIPPKTEATDRPRLVYKTLMDFPLPHYACEKLSREGTWTRSS